MAESLCNFGMQVGKWKKQKFFFEMQDDGRLWTKNSPMYIWNSSFFIFVGHMLGHIPLMMGISPLSNGSNRIHLHWEMIPPLCQK